MKQDGITHTPSTKDGKAGCQFLLKEVAEQWVNEGKPSSWYGQELPTDLLPEPAQFLSYTLSLEGPGQINSHMVDGTRGSMLATVSTTKKISEQKKHTDIAISYAHTVYRFGREKFNEYMSELKIKNAPVRWDRVPSYDDLLRKYDQDYIDATKSFILKRGKQLLIQELPRPVPSPHVFDNIPVDQVDSQGIGSSKLKSTETIPAVVVKDTNSNTRGPGEIHNEFGEHKHSFNMEVQPLREPTIGELAGRKFYLGKYTLDGSTGPGAVLGQLPLTFPGLGSFSKGGTREMSAIAQIMRNFLLHNGRIKYTFVFVQNPISRVVVAFSTKFGDYEDCPQTLPLNAINAQYSLTKEVVGPGTLEITITSPNRRKGFLVPNRQLFGPFPTFNPIYTGDMSKYTAGSMLVTSLAVPATTQTQQSMNIMVFCSWEPSIDARGFGHNNTAMTTDPLEPELTTTSAAAIIPAIRPFNRETKRRERKVPETIIESQMMKSDQKLLQPVRLRNPLTTYRRLASSYNILQKFYAPMKDSKKETINNFLIPLEGLSRSVALAHFALQGIEGYAKSMYNTDVKVPGRAVLDRICHLDDLTSMFMQRIARLKDPDLVRKQVTWLTKNEPQVLENYTYLAAAIRNAMTNWDADPTVSMEKFIHGIKFVGVMNGGDVFTGLDVCLMKEAETLTRSLAIIAFSRLPQSQVNISSEGIVYIEATSIFKSRISFPGNIDWTACTRSDLINAGYVREICPRADHVMIPHVPNPHTTKLMFEFSFQTKPQQIRVMINLIPKPIRVITKDVFAQVPTLRTESQMDAPAPEDPNPLTTIEDAGSAVEDATPFDVKQVDRPVEKPITASDITSKQQIFGQFQWTTALNEGETLFTLALPTDCYNNYNQIQKSQYKWVEYFHFLVTIVFPRNPFTAGLMALWAAHGVKDESELDRRFASLSQIMMTDPLLIHPNTSQKVTLKVPFKYILPYLVEGEQTAFVRGTIFSPLTYPAESASEDPMRVTVYTQIVDARFHLVKPVTIVPQMMSGGALEDKSDTTESHVGESTYRHALGPAIDPSYACDIGGLTITQLLSKHFFNWGRLSPSTVGDVTYTYNLPLKDLLALGAHTHFGPERLAAFFTYARLKFCFKFLSRGSLSVYYVPPKSAEVGAEYNLNYLRGPYTMFALPFSYTNDQLTTNVVTTPSWSLTDRRKLVKSKNDIDYLDLGYLMIEAIHPKSSYNPLIDVWFTVAPDSCLEVAQFLPKIDVAPITENDSLWKPIPDSTPVEVPAVLTINHSSLSPPLPFFLDSNHEISFYTGTGEWAGKPGSTIYLYKPTQITVALSRLSREEIIALNPDIRFTDGPLVFNGSATRSFDLSRVAVVPTRCQYTCGSADGSDLASLETIPIHITTYPSSGSLVSNGVTYDLVQNFDLYYYELTRACKTDWFNLPSSTITVAINVTVAPTQKAVWSAKRTGEITKDGVTPYNATCHKPSAVQDVVMEFDSGVAQSV